jgi:hypothetical protein
MNASNMNNLGNLAFLFVGDLNCSCSTCRFNLSDERHTSIIAHPTFPPSVLKIAFLPVKMAEFWSNDKLRWVGRVSMVFIIRLRRPGSRALDQR